MGITGLLPLMKAATTDVKLNKLSGTVAAIDTNGWIHRACYSCGDKVYLNEETDMYINYCVNLCGVLRKHNITPILVFDGQSLPAKAETKAKRQKRKAEVRQKIEEMLSAGDNRGARWLMRQCVDVTFEMIHRVIVRCREEKIDCVVAPFEADAQITYLVNHGIADYAVTEDSDLLVFGCQKTLYKLDRENEKGSMLTLDKLNKCFKNFCEKKFQYMCILSGCDYLSNIPNVGMGRARKFFETLTSVPMQLDTIREHLKTIPAVLNMVGKVQVTNEYVDSFVRAVQTFDHQLVYSPFTGRLTHLKNLQGGLRKHHELKLGQYAGDFFNAKEATDFVTHYVLGNVHTKTLQKIDKNYSPFQEEENNTGELAIWFSDAIQQRVKSKKTLTSMVSSLFVPESPIKTKVVEENRDSKRKVWNNVEKDSELPAKRAKETFSAKKSPKTPREANRKKIVEKEEDSLSVSVTEELITINETTRPSRSSRNVFRRSSTEMKSTTKVTNGKSAYFNKANKQLTTVEIVEDNLKPLKTSPLNKKTTANKKAAKVFDVDSDFCEDVLPKLKLKKKQSTIDLNVSVSSIDEEDKVILTSLNSTQSSGYYSSSQQTTITSTSSTISSQSPPLSSQSINAFTKLKSPVKSKGSSSDKKSSARTSTASKRPSRGSAATPTTAQKDIRSFFSKRSP